MWDDVPLMWDNFTSAGPGDTAGLALICDCDGVLIDSETVVGRVMVEALRKRWGGLDVAHLVQPLLGRRIAEVLHTTADQVGRRLADEEVQAIRAEVLAAAIQAPMVAGVDLALADIPLRKACASNSLSAYVAQVLRRTGLGLHFGDRVFTGDQVTQPKPAPDVYLLAARTLGVPPARCLVVEDSVAGALAAHAAGMTVLGYVGGAHDAAHQAQALRAVGASDCFARMSELPARAQRWASGPMLEGAGRLP